MDKAVQFGECAQIIRDIVDPNELVDVHYIGLEHIGEGTLALAGLGKSEDVTSAKSRFVKGDILFGKLRPYFRKLVRPQFGGICSTDIWVIRPTDIIDVGYLFFLMSTKEFIEAATSSCEGTRMPRASWSFLQQLEVRLPPLSRQLEVSQVLTAFDHRVELNRQMTETLCSQRDCLTTKLIDSTTIW